MTLKRSGYQIMGSLNQGELEGLMMRNPSAERPYASTAKCRGEPEGEDVSPGKSEGTVARGWLFSEPEQNLLMA